MQHIKLFFLEEIGGPEKGRVWWLYYHRGKNLGAGASTGATTTGRASHSPLFYSYSSSHWDVEGWMVCLCIPVLRRMRCGERIIPPIFLLVTDSLHLHFQYRIINQIFDPSTHLQHLLMILNHLQNKFTCILYSIHCFQ